MYKANYLLIYGQHACFAILESKKRKIYKIYIIKDLKKEIDQYLDSKLKNNVIIVDKNQLNKICKIEDKHQGIALEVSNIDTQNNLDFSNNLEKEMIIILDQIQDPNNLGNIIRTTFGFGIKTLIISKENSCPITAAVIRSSVGYSEKMNIIYMNISQAIQKLKEQNFWIFATDSHSTVKIQISNIMDKYEKLAFIFGSEGYGIRQQIKKNSDFLIKIPTSDEIESLNISTSVSIIAYEFYKNLIKN